MYVPKEHFDRILNTPLTPNLTVALRGIIILVANTGVHVGEVPHLEWPGIDFEKRLIRLREKPNCPTRFGMDWKPKWGEERREHCGDVIDAEISRKIENLPEED